MKAKEFIPATKPRNFVAKNQKTAGAGAHRDKKKEQKQGYEKHKGKGVAEGSDELYQKAIRKYTQRVAHDYLGGGNEHVYGANKFDSEMFGVDPKQAKQDFDRLFPEFVKKLQGVAEGISVVDQDYDLDQMHLTLDIEGKKVYFTYTDYDENFENAERKDVFDQLQEKSWYKGLDHPTKMEILDAAYKAIRGEEPSEYKPTVDDEPMDERVNGRDTGS